MEQIQSLGQNGWGKGSGSLSVNWRQLGDTDSLAKEAWSQVAALSGWTAVAAHVVAGIGCEDIP